MNNLKYNVKDINLIHIANTKERVEEVFSPFPIKS